MDDLVWAISIHIWKLTIPRIGPKMQYFVLANISICILEFINLILFPRINLVLANNQNHKEMYIQIPNCQYPRIPPHLHIIQFSPSKF